MVENKCIETFKYDHSLAIKNYKPVDCYCQVNYGVPNEYLKNILDSLQSIFYRFTDGNTHRDDDKFILEDTIGVIITYTINDNNNKYSRKIMIKDGDIINVIKDKDTMEILDIVRGNDNDGQYKDCNKTN